MKSKNYVTKNSGGGCGCGSGNPIVYGQNGGGCAACSKMEGGEFTIDPTSYFSQNNYPLNSHNVDPMMQTNSSRMEGVPISNTLNNTGSNDILLGGKKRKHKHKKSKRTKSKKNKTKQTKRNKTKSKRNKTKQTKRNKTQRGGINLGYVGQNSLLGHGQYGTWFGAPTTNTPDWNSSIFTNPVNQNTTGYSEYNPYLV